MRQKLLFAVTGMGMIAAIALQGQSVPTTINYQGRLTDNTPSQTPISGPVTMKFELYDAASTGTQLWSEPASGGVSVSVVNGIFSVALGSSVAIPPTVFTGGSSIRYLQITLNPGASQEILSPRQLITATGYANLAQNANNAVNATSATTATNAIKLGGVAASGYLLTSGTAADSTLLGGSPAASYQKRTAAGAFTCSGSQVLQSAAADGTPACVTPAVTETDPKVGTLADGRVPRWNGGATQLENGALFDGGANGNIGVGTASPITQLQVAGRLSFAGANNAGLNGATSAFIQGRYAYLTSYYNNSLVVFDISNPASPVSVGATTTGLNGPFNVHVEGRYAFVTSFGNNSLVVFDISNPASPVNVGASNAGLSAPYAVVVQGRYAYVTSQTNDSLVIFDIANPASPVNVGATSAGLSQPVSVYVQGRYAYVTGYTNASLVIFDISNPASPVNVGATTTGLSYPYSVHVQGRYAYVASNGNNSLVIVDISNPAAPVYVGATAAGLNGPDYVYVQGRYAFVTNYASGALAVFDVANAASPAWVAASSTGLSQPYSVQVQGRYAYLASKANNALVSYDLGGAYIQQLESGGIETGTLSANGNAQLNGDTQIKGGLVVGSGGIYSEGNLGVFGQVKIAGGAPGLNKVLISDAAGLGSWAALDAGNISAGILPVANGGSGAATLTGLLLGNGTSPFTAITTSAGIAGAVSDETGSGALVFATSPTVTGLTVSSVGTGTALSATGPGAVFGSAMIATTGSGGRTIDSRNTSANVAVFGSSATGDHFMGSTDTSLFANPQFRITNTGNILGDGVLVVGTDITTSTALAFNSIGTGSPTSGQITSGDDLFIADDLEIAGTLYAKGFVGIGTTTPTNLLQVKNPADNGASIRVGGNASTLIDKKIFFGDGAFVFVGEDAANDDVLALHGASGVRIPDAVITGPMQIGAAGTSISKSTRYAVTVLATIIPINSCTDIAAAGVTGETAGADCAVGPPALPAAGLTWNCVVTGATAATLRLCNVTAAGITPATATWNIRVFTP